MLSKQIKDIAYQINPHLFILLQKEAFILWDYQNHNQWEVGREYIEALEDISQGKAVDDIILQEFIETGILTQEGVEEMEWGWDPVSKIYHIASSNIFEDIQKKPDELIEEYMASCEGVSDPQTDYERCDYSFESSFSPALEEVSLAQALRDRKTTRNFNGQPISFKQLGDLLFASCGEIHETWTDLTDSGFNAATKRRSFPSGGALYPIRYFVLALAVEGLETGVYEYIPEANGLTTVRLLQGANITQDLTDILCSQFFCEGLAVGLFFVPDFPKEWGKYPHSRSYRDIFLDIGHCSQSCLLVATAMGIRTWITAAYKDKKLQDFLGIDGAYNFPVECIGLGCGDSHSLPRKLLEK